MLPLSMRRAAVATSLACLLLAAGAPTVAIGDGGAITVSGSVVETVRFSVGDPVAELGSHLVPEGPGHVRADGAEVVEIGGSDASVCYVASSEITVSSNVEYELVVSGRGSRAELRFLPGMPESFAACAAGEPVSDSMFATLRSVGVWASGQSRTVERTHPFALGLIVRPGDEPPGVLDSSAFTVLVRASG